jgi:hypothetical protein
MKKVIILIVLAVSMTVNAQWVQKYYVDDFGEPTTNKYESFLTHGTFSNSASQNANCTYVFIKSDNTITIKVLEYGKHLATSPKATFESIRLKQPDGTVSTIKGAFFTKKGRLYLSEETYTEFHAAIQAPGNYIMLFKRSGSYSDSDYKVKFTIK